MKRLPIRIEPNRIREAFIQVYYRSHIPFEAMVGYFWGYLQSLGYTYSNQQHNRGQRPLIILETGSGQNQLNILPTQHFFFNDEIKIQLNPNNSMLFNIRDNYIGGKKYLEHIIKAIKLFKDSGIISVYNRIGVRYVTEFPNIDIIENINFSYKLPFQTAEPKNTTFRFEWQEIPHTVILKLFSKLNIPTFTGIGTTNSSTDFISIIDIDVIQTQFEETESIEMVVKNIEQARILQKTTFFELLKEDFLQTLHPIYE